jgi:lysozyme
MDIPVEDLDTLEKDFVSDEGKRRRGYRCPAGFWTIGIGHNTEGKDLSDRAIRVMFEDDVADAVTDLDAIWIGWRGLSENRKHALINLSFQLGQSRFLGFPNFWAAMRAHNFGKAAAELRNSLWYGQTQALRTQRVIKQIMEG